MLIYICSNYKMTRFSHGLFEVEGLIYLFETQIIITKQTLSMFVRCTTIYFAISSKFTFILLIYLNKPTIASLIISKHSMVKLIHL